MDGRVREASGRDTQADLVSNVSGKLNGFIASRKSAPVEGGRCAGRTCARSYWGERVLMSLPTHLPTRSRSWLLAGCVSILGQMVGRHLGMTYPIRGSMQVHNKRVRPSQRWPIQGEVPSPHRSTPAWATPNGPRACIMALGLIADSASEGGALSKINRPKRRSKHQTPE